MAKLTLNDITSGFNSTTALNDNFSLIEQAFENTVSRDGTTPNTMSADLDMNGYRILNELAYTGDGFIWKGAWQSGTTYQINNLVQSNGNTYVCTTTHQATAWATNLTDGWWELVAARGQDGGGAGDLVAANNLSDAGLTPAIALSNLGGQPSSAKLTSYTNNTLTAANKIPYATALNTAGELDLSTNTSLGTSDTTVPTQNAVKTYADTKNIATQVVPSTSGNVLTSTGSSWVSSAPTNKVLQIVHASIAAATVSTSIPLDNTTPLSTEGTEVVTATITPASNTNKVIIQASFSVTHSNADSSKDIIAAVFRGGTCIGAALLDTGGPTNGVGVISISVVDSPASAAAVTYSIRVGDTGSGDVYVNKNGTATLGGMLATSAMILTELSV